MYTDEQVKAHVAANVRRLRGERTLTEIAKACCVDGWTCYPATIQQIESGRHLPNSALLSRVAEALGCTTDQLISPPPGVKKIRQAS